VIMVMMMMMIMFMMMMMLIRPMLLPIPLCNSYSVDQQITLPVRLKYKYGIHS
jgi:hypothetical protein